MVDVFENLSYCEVKAKGNPDYHLKKLVDLPRDYADSVTKHALYVLGHYNLDDLATALAERNRLKNWNKQSNVVGTFELKRISDSDTGPSLFHVGYPSPILPKMTAYKE